MTFLEFADRHADGLAALSFIYVLAALVAYVVHKVMGVK